jgi:hypothetical protein
MLALVFIVIFWPGTVTYWIDNPVKGDASKTRIELPMPDDPTPLDFGTSKR